ncbi:MAG: hypothetical protein ACI3YL_05480 [Prevotella sp.]|nr:hypothetical protein [Prevotella sp.]MCI5854976.1 hypothetical protein [Prevotella sp.]MDD6737424.1 hypothetical protein [Prevotella sp.]MDY6092385.1 hypothetical protein [Prevotella sp.]
MKKVYIHPEIMVLEIEVEQPLASSPGVSLPIKGGTDIPEEDDEEQML